MTNVDKHAHTGGMDEQALTTTELAEHFGVHPTTIRRGVEDGTIPHYRTPGGHLRYHLHAVTQVFGKPTS